jgi:hypothetical protein
MSSPTYRVVFVCNQTKERKPIKDFDNILFACDYIDLLHSTYCNEHNVTPLYGKYEIDTYKNLEGSRQ